MRRKEAPVTASNTEGGEGGGGAETASTTQEVPRVNQRRGGRGHLSGLDYLLYSSNNNRANAPGYEDD